MKKLIGLTIVALFVTSLAFATNQTSGEMTQSTPSNFELHPNFTPDEQLHRVAPKDVNPYRDAPEPEGMVLTYHENFEAEDDIFYYNGVAYVWYCPEEALEFGTRFTAYRPGDLVGAWFYWYSGNGGNADVHVYADDGTGYPGAGLGSLTVTPVLGTWNYVDLTSLAIAVDPAADFFITYSVQAGDTVNIVSDDGSSGQNRSVEQLPTVKDWTYVIDDYGADYEWCIDAVIEHTTDPWVPEIAGRWQLVDTDFNSPTHSWWIADNPAYQGYNWISSNPIQLTDEYGLMEIDFAYRSSLPDAVYPDEYWSFYIGNTANAIDWHASTYNGYNAGTSWYCGDEVLHEYGTSAIYYLYTPDIDLTDACEATLTCMLDYDMEAPGGEDPPFDGWDVATIQISTDGWATKSFLEDPTNPYNVTVAFAGWANTSNPADTLSYPGWGGPNPAGWFAGTFDLTPYIGEIVQIRFTLASDPYSVAEGFWVDNVDIDKDGTIIFSDYDETNLIPDAPVVVLEELDYLDAYTDSDWVYTAAYDISLYAGEEVIIKMKATLADDAGTGEGFWFDDIEIYGANLPLHDMGAMFNVMPYGATEGEDYSPGIVYGNFGTSLEAPQLKMDNLDYGTTPFDYYNNNPTAIDYGEYELGWLTQLEPLPVAGWYDFMGWTYVGGDEDTSNDTTYIYDIEVYPPGYAEFGNNSRVWNQDFYTSGYCGNWFDIFPSSRLTTFDIYSVWTQVVNYGETGDTDVWTIEIFEAIDDITPGALLLTESFDCTGIDGGDFGWVEFVLTTPLHITGNVIVMQSGPWVDVNAGTPGVSYWPVFDNMVRQYLGVGAYYGHSIYGDIGDPSSWGHSSGDRFVNIYGRVDYSTGPDVPSDASYLSQNVPNPVTNNATISYNIKGSPMNKAEIKIFNVLGQLVDTIQGENGVATWNPGTAPNGVYFYKVSSDDFTSVKKMILMR